MDPAGVRAHYEGAAREQSQIDHSAQPGDSAVSSPYDHLADTYPLPRSVAALTHRVVDLGGELLLSVAFKVRVEGREHIPQNTNFLVVSNHCSHLDYALVAHILRKQRKKLYVLAASDYFFNTKLKRTYCQKCTNLLPMHREVPLHRALPHGQACLAAGNNLLVFPEGTRSLDGRMSRFKRTAAVLCLKNLVDVLPIYLYGTHEALPKGKTLFRSRRLGACIGPVLSNEHLAGETLGRGMKFNAATVRVTERIQQAVEALRDGRQA